MKHPTFALVPRVGTVSPTAVDLNEQIKMSTVVDSSLATSHGYTSVWITGESDLTPLYCLEKTACCLPYQDFQCSACVVTECGDIISSFVYLFSETLDGVVVELLCPLVYINILVCHWLKLGQLPLLIQKTLVVVVAKFVLLIKEAINLL